MSDNLEIILLGTSNAEGIPMLGCSCDTCSNGKSIRSRSSVFININGTKILIDAGPDIRSQLIRHNIVDIDALLITHIHFDHIGGLDELRSINIINNKVIPVYASDYTGKLLMQRVPHLFEKRTSGSMAARLNLNILDDDAGFINIFENKIKFVSYSQDVVKVNGFIINDIAYLVDIKSFDESIKAELLGLKYLIMGVAQGEFSRMHMNMNEVIAFATDVKAKELYLTHIGHYLNITEQQKVIPEWVKFSYDGMVLKSN